MVILCSYPSLPRASAASPKVLRTPCRLGRDSQACKFMQIAYRCIKHLKWITIKASGWDLLCLSVSDLGVFCSCFNQPQSARIRCSWHAKWCSCRPKPCSHPWCPSVREAPTAGWDFLAAPGPSKPQSRCETLQLSAWKAGHMKQRCHCCKDHVKTIHSSITCIWVYV